MEYFKQLRDKAAKAISNPDLYLTSFMAQLDEKSSAPLWILHFYNPLEDTIISYNSEDGSLRGPDDVFKEEDFIPELDIEQAKVNYEKALDIAFEQALPEKDFSKIVVLLQNIDEITLWNFTFLNKTYHALNVRINAADGTVIKKEPFQLFHFEKGNLRDSLKKEGEQGDGEEEKSEK